MKRSTAAGSVDWLAVATTLLRSRAIDRCEESVLYPQKRIAYQFSARGHELIQILLAEQLSSPLDAATVYYRSRPFLLSCGLTPVEAFAGPLGKRESITGGRDIGVVFHLRSRGRATVLPMSGDIGAQYTPAAGWAEALKYRAEVLGEAEAAGGIAVALGGEGSAATGGFWSALNVATTISLPLLFFIEDNGYAISVPSNMQFPGGDIAANLRSFLNLRIFEGDGTEPEEAAELIADAVSLVRTERRPALIRFRVPRLSGHSIQDSQSYKDAKLIERERENDPLLKLQKHLVPGLLSEDEWTAMERRIDDEIADAMQTALALPDPDSTLIARHRFSERNELVASAPDTSSEAPVPSGARVTMGEAIRKTLASELKRDARLVVFGEDVGAKGGVHAVTLGLQSEFGERRVYDTSLSEEGIAGRAIGMSYAGLRPVAEIQFRKYVDPATEQLHNCGTVRWRTAGDFSAPIVVRVAGGFSRRAGDPWHSMSGESEFVRAVGWHVYIPSTVADAVGLLRWAIRGDDPVLFFEHRALLDAPSARGIYPGDGHLVRPGHAAIRRTGDRLTVVTWGGMVERCLAAADYSPGVMEVVDLRTVAPWDCETVIASVTRTHRLLVVHEDGITAGFGAEIVASVVEKAFSALDAPARRLAPADIPIPYHPQLMEAVLPTIETIADAISDLLSF